MLYALIDAAGTVRRMQDFSEPPPELAPEKAARWFMVQDVRPETGPGEILIGPVETLDGDVLRRVWTAAPAPPPPVPPVVTMAQARAALGRAGLMPQVEAAVAALGGEAAIAWEYTTEVRRDIPLVAALAAALNLSDDAVDDLFRVAATVTFENF